MPVTGVTVGAVVECEEPKAASPIEERRRFAVDAFRRPEGVKVTYRRMKFDFEDQGFERYWMAGSPFKSLFWTQLSTAFAPGEKFFIDSARALKDKITDPEL